MKRPELKRPELKRPSLKGPELKPPAFLADLYYDLRDRRLLPLLALVLVAIAAAPFLLGNKSEPVVAPSAAALATEGESLGPTSHLRVVEATPGLRDYRKRLRDRTPTDPFVQKFTGPVGGGSGGSGGEASATASAEGSSSPNSFSEEAVSTTESSTTTVEVSGEGGSSSGGGGGASSNGSGEGGSGGSNGSPGTGHVVLFDYAIDVQTVYSPPAGEGGAQQQPEPVVKHRVLPQTPLPGEKAPVVTYLGPGRKQGDKATGRVLLSVSADVNSISGEHRCVSTGGAGGVCQLLEVKPGFPLTFAYGEGGAHFTIKVLSVELVVVGHT